MGRWLAGSVVVLAVAAASPARANTQVAVPFSPNGPNGINTDHSNGVWAGSINSLATDPADPDTVWVGSTNGGVWKTTNATSANPSWEPLTDHQASLAVSALTLDPADPEVVIAGIGHSSSFPGGKTAPLTGLLRSTDGGTTWDALGTTDLAGQDVTAVQARGATIVVATKKGIYRSTDTGASFIHKGTAAGIVIGTATDLVGDPSHPLRLYAAIADDDGGVFTSADSGATWQFAGGLDFGLGTDLVTDARKIVVSASPGVVYAGVVGSDSNPSGIFRSDDHGASWTALDIPALEQAAQGRLSILADPDNADLLFLGGDESPGGNGEGPVYRCDSSLAAGSQCSKFVTDGTASDTAPHPDSRRMQFDAAGNLLEVDDGGIFKRTHPRGDPTDGDWSSLDGDMAITEAHSCGYDSATNVTICGTQDNGTVEQSAPGPVAWEEALKFDGGMVAVSETGSVSSKYYSSQRIGQFSRQACVGFFCAVVKPALTIEPDGVSLDDTVDASIDDFLYVPIAVDTQDQGRLVVGTATVYESDDGGETLHRLSGFVDGDGNQVEATRAIAMGAANEADALYVGSSNGLFLHTTKFGALTRLDAYPGSAPDDIAIDPADWRSAWVLDGDTVWHTSDGGSSWIDVTADLAAQGAKAMNTIAYVAGASPPVVLVGASDGLYATDTAQARHWYKLSGALPNAVVYELDYDATDDLLLVSALGRSTWTVSGASSSIRLPTPTVLHYTGATSEDYHDTPHLSATLAEAGGAPLAGKSVRFQLGTQACSATTDASGVAACQVVLDQQPAGVTVSATFAGDESYAPSDDSAPFTITKEETTTTYVGPTMILQGASGVTLKGRLLEDGIVPIAGRTLRLKLGGQSCTGTTGSTGVASCTLAFTGTLGPQPLEARFGGDGFYLASADPSATAVVFAFPSRGVFTLGDRTVALAQPSTSVTWWADDWYLLNSLSGGAAPSAFKGFAATVTLPTSTPPAACGGNWTTLPGNSPPPTAGVPAYMGVVATSNVSKSGNAVSGDTVHIVVVKVGAGYAPTPVSHGTGTIVGTYC